MFQPNKFNDCTFNDCTFFDEIKNINILEKKYIDIKQNVDIFIL